MRWDFVRLGDLATFVNGFPFKPSEWTNEGIEIIRIQNLTKSSSESNYYDGTIPEKYRVKNGDILISWSATLDVFVWDGSDAWLNQHIFKVVFDKTDIDKKFFIYLIKNVLEEMRRSVHGATMQHITKDRFDNLQVPQPPLPIQKRIAEILDAADALKRKDQELLKKYDELAQAIFIDMFGDPVRNDKGWKLKKIKKITSLITYGLTVRPKYLEQGIPLISARELRDGFINYHLAPKISIEDFNSLSNKCKPQKGDILFSKTGSIGLSAVVVKDIHFAVTQNAARITFDTSLIDIRFIFSLLNTESFINACVRLVKGNAVKDLQLGDFSEIEIIVPPLDIQKQFALKIEKTNQLIIISKQVEDNSKFLFNSLIQKAFNCELIN